MIRTGQTIENPVTGERVVFRRTSADSKGEAVVIDVFVGPHGSVAAAHVHPSQDERFEVLTGTLAMRRGRETVEVRSGATVVVPAGTSHKFWNAGDTTAHFVCEVRPALRFESLLETMFALAADGKTNRKGMPNPLRLAVIAQAHFDTVRLPFLPVWMQGLVWPWALHWAACSATTRRTRTSTPQLRLECEPDAPYASTHDRPIARPHLGPGTRHPERRVETPAAASHNP